MRINTSIPMKNQRLLRYCLVGMLFPSMSAMAQVGIGNPNPDVNSILDLRNTNNRSLLLPTATTAPDVTMLSVEGMMIYYQGNIYYRSGAGIKVLTPWNYDGTPANGVYSDAGTPISIGGANLATPAYRLRIVDPASGDVSATGSNASLMLGSNSAGIHMLLDGDEIMVKSDATTGGILKLQEDGGTVQIRNAATVTATPVLTVYGSADVKGKVMENGDTLIPRGTIAMFYGATAPAGWAICNGTNGTPDLRDRFVVSVGPSYALGATGGAASVTLDITQMPGHTHDITHGHVVNDPGHSHGIVGYHGVGSGSGNSKEAVSSKNGVTDYGAPGKMGRMYNANTGISINNFTGNTGAAGGGQAHENRPPYYAITYIMKL